MFLLLLLLFLFSRIPQWACSTITPATWRLWCARTTTWIVTMNVLYLPGISCSSCSCYPRWWWCTAMLWSFTSSGSVLKNWRRWQGRTGKWRNSLVFLLTDRFGDIHFTVQLNNDLGIQLCYKLAWTMLPYCVYLCLCMSVWVCVSVCVCESVYLCVSESACMSEDVT